MGELIGVGCDTEERARLARTLERDPGFLPRWFSAAECAAIAAAPDPTGLALRIFCLKEAAIKALWRELPLGPAAVQALPGPNGAYNLSLTIVAQSPPCLTGRCGGDEVHAWAEVLAWGEGPKDNTQRLRDAERNQEWKSEDVSSTIINASA